MRRDLGNVRRRQIVRGGEMTIVPRHRQGRIGGQIEEIVLASREGVPITVRDVGDVVRSATRLAAERRPTTVRAKSCWGSAS